MNLNELFANLKKRYGRRNKLHMSRAEAFALLFDGKARLDRCIRKGEGEDVLGDELASMMARIWMCTNTYADDVPIAREFTRKYPAYGCAYCRHKPCQCGYGKRPDITIAAVDPQQIDWSITRTCEHSKEVYGRVNEERGIDKALLRLSEEINELHRIEYFDSLEEGATNSELIENVGYESADSIAWTLNIAVLLKIPIEQYLVERYTGPCQRCGFMECECTSPFLLKKRARPHRSGQPIAETKTAT